MNVNFLSVIVCIKSMLEFGQPVFFFMQKLRVLDSSLCQLQDRVVTLTDENRELQEAVASLSEAQETRTEASGTESELVHRKTPSIHSDLSDAELSDSPEHGQVSWASLSRGHGEQL